MKSNNNFIRKLYLMALFPNIIAVLGGTINVFFDGILVGQKLGELGLESVNQSLPVYLILCTIGSLFASGASFLSSIAIGRNDQKEGQRILKATLLTSAIAGLLFCALGYVFVEPITRLLATEVSFSYVLTYLKITLIGGVFKVLLYVPYFYLRLEGKNRRSASAMLTMTMLNIVLDYIFLFVLDWGIAGAAWASVIATVVAFILCMTFLFTDHSNFKLGFGFFRKDDWADIIKYGSPMALNNILSSARILVVNLILKSMGISGLTAIFAVVNNLNEFSICVQNGVPQTATAMTGIFHGERDSNSVKRLLNIQLATGALLSSVLGLAMILFSGQLGRLFGSDADCTFAILCFGVSLPFGTVNSVMSYFYNATGRISIANIITSCRGFATVALFCLSFSPLGEGVWLFYPVAEISAMLVFLIAGASLKKKQDLSAFYLLDESFEKSGQSISFSVDCSPERICEASEKINEFCDLNEFTPKKAMAISLSIEEILTIIAQKSLMGVGVMDVRVLKSGDEGIIRIRSGGRRYNPIEAADDSLDYMGVKMIVRLATKVEYLSSLGVNTLMIFV